MYDAVIVGAGPAGCAAACHASRLGLRTLLLDRSRFPRPKTCGDGLTPRALAALERMGVGDLSGHRIRGLRVINLSSGCCRTDDFRDHAAPHEGLVVSRHVLDARLVRRACDMGATFREAHVTGVIQMVGQLKSVRLDDGSIIKTPAVITAAGAAGFGRLARHDVRPVWGIAARAYLSVHHHPGHDFEFYVPIEVEGLPRTAYGWVFPAGPRLVNIGIAASPAGSGTHLSVRRLVARFIAERIACDPRLRGAVSCSRIESAPIPFGPVLPNDDGVLQVGDCAGLPSGLSGEGISQALESGELAALSIARGAHEAAATYRRLAGNTFAQQIAVAPGLARLHRASCLALGRGVDLLCRADDAAARALWAVLWNTTRESVARRTGKSDIDSAIATVRRRLVLAIRRIRPLLGELVAALTQEPDSTFGWYTALAAASRATQLPGAPLIPESAHANLAALEAVNLVATLHEEMPRRATPARGETTWGRQTLSLVLADCLTSYALQTMNRVESSLARTIGEAARRMLRDAAVHANVDGRPRVVNRMRHEPLFGLAIAIGLERPGSTIDQTLRAVARCMAAARTGVAPSPADWGATATVDDPLRTFVEHVLGLVHPPGLHEHVDRAPHAP